MVSPSAEGPSTARWPLMVSDCSVGSLAIDWASSGALPRTDLASSAGVAWTDWTGAVVFPVAEVKHHT